jgi:hypothetical protein
LKTAAGGKSNEHARCANAKPYSDVNLTVDDGNNLMLVLTMSWDACPFAFDATELIAVGQQGSASQALYDVIHSKHHRKADQGMENVVLKFIELCVNLRRGKLAKEALHQYKKNSQSVNAASFEVSPASGCLPQVG